jgi:dienelactone hydrolase
MADVLLFHHAQGLTDGVRDFAQDLMVEGHRVHLPDLYEGHTFEELDDGMAYVEGVGFQAIIERGAAVAQDLPHDLVYVGMSLGVLPAQMLAQTRPGARGAVFLHSAVPPEEFGGSWPKGLPLQIHTMADDELGDVDVARQLVAGAEGAELFVYPGDGHLFTDSSLDAYDEEAAELVRLRLLAFLAPLG